MHWRDRDRLKAKERMRRLRANGTTEYDQARNHAMKKLVHTHRSEFLRYRDEFLVFLREQRKGSA